MQAVGQGGQQAMAAGPGLGAGVGHDETAGAVGALAGALGKAALADQRRLLVARHASDRNWGAEPLVVGHAEVMGVVADFGQQGGGNIEVVQQLLIPLLPVDVEQLGS